MHFAHRARHAQCRTRGTSTWLPFPPLPPVPPLPPLALPFPPAAGKHKVNSRSNLFSVCCNRQVHVSGSSYVAAMAHCQCATAKSIAMPGGTVHMSYADTNEQVYLASQATAPLPPLPLPLPVPPVPPVAVPPAPPAPPPPPLPVPTSTKINHRG